MKQLLPWYWRSQTLNNRTAAEIFEKLFYHSDRIATLLESPVGRTGKLARYSICAGKPRLVDGKLQLWTFPLGKILSSLNSLVDRCQMNNNTAIAHLPFTGGWLGWLGYDLAWEIERLPDKNRDPLPFPVAYWYEPDCFAVLDHQQQTLWLAATVPQQLDELEARLEFAALVSSSISNNVARSILAVDRPQSFLETENYRGYGSLFEVDPQASPRSNSAKTLPNFSFQTSQLEYQHAVRQAKKYIQAGDIFQTNLSLRFQTATKTDSWTIYQNLKQINPSPFASYWRSPWGDVVSCSPERLIKLQDNVAETRPIAGTRPRGKTTESDSVLAGELVSNSKERAEHVMLVDLERNDLGRVCQWGSVTVDELLEIERYSHVMHLVSNVRGILPSDRNAVDLIRAMFPGGTITGCPKVRCMEIIEELEPVRRSLFYGSCGYLDCRGNLDLNILIRSLLYINSAKPNTTAMVYGQVGAGIVADSDPEKEWHESLNKAEAQIAALSKL
ncbi:aminodeoxychorismate synthase, component I [Myxosarcina sp. GI1]|uniref:aminodeoxychorismate synthase, component I n=1 Tax=Myxosarcina sp. GI1 TaxID=1541065 RepID=UPI00055E2660|nr:aminodeoxychorismate synthase, component I [Myxosarcina sp. GI1]